MNWKYNDYWNRWENIDRFSVIEIKNQESKEGPYPICATLFDNSEYHLAIFSNKIEAQIWLRNFINGDLCQSYG
jgi:hypothetical protein